MTKAATKTPKAACGKRATDDGKYVSKEGLHAAARKAGFTGVSGDAVAKADALAMQGVLMVLRLGKQVGHTTVQPSTLRMLAAVQAELTRPLRKGKERKRAMKGGDGGTVLPAAYFGRTENAYCPGSTTMPGGGVSGIPEGWIREPITASPSFGMHGGSTVLPPQYFGREDHQYSPSSGGADPAPPAGWIRDSFHASPVFPVQSGGGPPACVIGPEGVQRVLLDIQRKNGSMPEVSAAAIKALAGIINWNLHSWMRGPPGGKVLTGSLMVRAAAEPNSFQL